MMSRKDADRRELSRMDPRDRRLILALRSEAKVKNDPYNSRVRKAVIERSLAEQEEVRVLAEFIKEAKGN